MQKSKPYVNGFCYVLMPKGLHHAETAWEAKELEQRREQKTKKPHSHRLPLMFCQSTGMGPPTAIFLSFQFIVSCRSNTSLVRASNLVCIFWLSWSGVEQQQEDTTQDRNKTGKTEWNKEVKMHMYTDKKTDTGETVWKDTN